MWFHNVNIWNVLGFLPHFTKRKTYHFRTIGIGADLFERKTMMRIVYKLNLFS